MAKTILIVDDSSSLRTVVKIAPADGRGDATTHAEPALAAMFSLLRGNGINPVLCEAYLFGGGNMFPQLYALAHVGSHNTSWALDELGRLGICLVSQDTGGTAYRRVTWTVGPDAPQVRLGET